MLASFLASALAFYVSKPYNSVIRHISLRELLPIFSATALKEALVFISLLVLPNLVIMSRLRVHNALAVSLLDGAMCICMLILVRVVMVLAYDYIRARESRTMSGQAVYIYGVSDKSVALISRLAQSPHYRVTGFVSEENESKGKKIADYPVYFFSDNAQLISHMTNHSIGGLLFSTERDLASHQDGIVKDCISAGLKVLFSPAIGSIDGGGRSLSAVREIKIEDLLGRDEVLISREEIEQRFMGRTIMVTGAAGSIGSELCRQMAMLGVEKLIFFDNAETPMHNLRLEFESHYPRQQFVPIIGDIRYEKRLDFVFRTYHPSVVLHAAAYKHVPLMEENPCEAVIVNVGGTRNVALKCIEYGVDTMVMISTDKAVNPTNIMGCTKRLAEIYVQSLGLSLEKGGRHGQTKFVTTRFGNVLGSNGSVIPRFREQIASGGPVTVTHPDIIRFFMTIPEACRLVMEATTLTSGNQIFAFDMGQPVKIDTLARRMIELAGLVPDKDIKIEYTGLRPGEKLYEEVLSSSENTVDTTHSRIKIAKVRQYEFADAERTTLELCDLALKVKIPEMICMMKKIVPEFRSQNSPYEVYDHQ